MRTLTAERAQAQLEAMLEQPDVKGPVRIEGQGGNAVLVPEALWSGAKESLALLSIPEMAESLRAGMNAPLEECDESLVW
jgi:antitoxin YefM